MNRSLRIALIAAVLAMLAGCGNKGPLMMPQKPVPIDPATVPAAPGEVPVEIEPTEAAPPTGDVDAAVEAEAEAETEADPPPADDDGNG